MVMQGDQPGKVSAATNAPHAGVFPLHTRRMNCVASYIDHKNALSGRFRFADFYNAAPRLEDYQFIEASVTSCRGLANKFTVMYSSKKPQPIQ